MFTHQFPRRPETSEAFATERFGVSASSERRWRTQNSPISEIERTGTEWPLPPNAVPDAREAAERDAADLLYRYGIGSVLVSGLASSGLALISAGQAPFRLLGFWWVLISGVLVLRGLDIFLFYRFRAVSARTGMQDIRRFGCGLTMTAVLWASYPIAFLGQLNQAGRACAAVVLCGMVGGSATVLAPSKVLSLVFSALLVLPAAILF